MKQNKIGIEVSYQVRKQTFEKAYTLKYRNYEEIPLIFIVEDYLRMEKSICRFQQELTIELFRGFIPKQQQEPNLQLVKQILNEIIDKQRWHFYSQQRIEIRGRKANISVKAEITKLQIQNHLKTLNYFNDKQVLAIAAFETMTLIMEIQTNFYLKSTSSIRNYLIQSLKKKFGKLFPQQSIAEITNLFEIIEYGEKNLPPAYSFHQRYKYASMKSLNFTFNPTYLTKNVFQAITSRSQNILIIGYGGLGKSVSTWLFTDLAYFIIQAQYNQNNQHNPYFKQKVKPYLLEKKIQKFFAIPKVYYISLINGKEEYIQYIIHSIKLQQPKINKNSNNLKSILTQLSQLYRFHSKCFIIDQINIYAALIRSCQKARQSRKQNAIQQLTSFFKDLQQLGFHLIFNSSINLEKRFLQLSMSETNVFCFLHSSKNTKECFVTKYNNFQKDSNQIRQFKIELAHSILFQLEYRNYDFQQKVKNYIQKFAWMINQMRQIQEYPLDEKALLITPYTICQFLKNHQLGEYQVNYRKAKDFSLNNQNYEQIDDLFCKIQLFSHKKILIDYNNFLNNKSFSFQLKQKKTRFIMKLVEAAGKAPLSAVSFDYFWTQKEHDQNIINKLEFINKERILIEKNYVTIYYSPRFFIQQIFGNLNLPVQRSKQQFSDFLKECSKNEQLMGFLLDKCYSFIISQYKIQLTVQGQLFNIQGGKGHFMQLNSKDQTLYSILHSIIKKYFSKGQCNTYIGLQPGKLLSQQAIFSSNSQAIDSLIISKSGNKENHFKIVTFDFSIAQRVQQKYPAAVKLFRSLVNRSQQEELQFSFQIVHYLVVTKKNVKKELAKLKKKAEKKKAEKKKAEKKKAQQQQEGQQQRIIDEYQQSQSLPQNIQIKFTAIEEFKIKILDNEESNKDYNTFYSQSLKIFEELLMKLPK